MKKTFFLAVFIIFLTFPVLSQGWGVITEDTESTIQGLEKNYTIGLINTGSDPVILEFSVPENEDYSISFDNTTIVLNPSLTTETPKGEGWFYAGKGEYVNVTYTDFHFKANEQRSSNKISFNVTVSSVSDLNPLFQNVPRSSLIDQRVLEYDVKVDETLVQGLDSGQDSIWADSPETSQEQKQGDVKNEKSKVNSRNKSSERRENDLEDQDESVNNTTWLLLAALAITVVYLFY